MKRFGKKIIDFTKIFLIFGLLFSNLSSLEVVFAYEGEDEVAISENVLVSEEENKEEETLLEDVDSLDEAVVEDTDTNEDVVGNNVDEENKEEILVREANIEEENKEENVEKTDVEVEENIEKTEENNQENVVSDENNTDETIQDENTEANVVDYTSLLNDSAALLGLDGVYLFNGEKLYVLVGVNEDEVSNIVSNAFSDASVSVVEDTVTISNNGEEVNYQVVVYNEEYLSNLMKVAIGNGTSSEDDDINGDGVVDVYDAATLRLILDLGFGSEVVKQDVSISSKLDGDTESLTVGDTFTVKYIMTLSDYGVDGITGLINYNKDLLRLDKVDVKNFADGSDYDGKFLYFGDYIMGEEVVTTDEDGNEMVTYEPIDYIIVEMTFTAINSGSDKVSVSDIGYFNGSIYYSGNDVLSKDVVVVSNDNTISSLVISGTSIPIDRLTDVYTVTVPNNVTEFSLDYVLADSNARVTSIVAPEQLAVGENTVTITVMAENGEERTYTITVVREDEEAQEEEEETTNLVNYENNDTYNDYTEGNDTKVVDKNKKDDKKEEDKDSGKLTRAIIIILILLAIAGLIYLIFKDDDEETKQVNKDINKLKKEELSDSGTKKVNNSKKPNNSKKTNKKER